MENTAPILDTPPIMVEVSALTRARLDEIDRLREIGFVKAADLRMARDGLTPSPILTPEQAFKLQMRYVGKFETFSRAIRQLMVLEFELLGLFEAPDRDAFPKLKLIKPDRCGLLDEKVLAAVTEVKPVTLAGFFHRDYRAEPLEQVVAGIRETLGAEAPVNDPFAADAERKFMRAAPAPKPPEPSTAAIAAPPPAKTPFPAPPPAMVKLPAPVRMQSAARVAITAFAARPDSNVRLPSAEPIPATRHGKHRQGRGPPG